MFWRKDQILPTTQRQEDAVEKKVKELATSDDSEEERKDEERKGGEELSSLGLVGMHHAINIDEMLKDENHKFQQSKREAYVPYAVAEENVKAMAEEMRRLKDSSLLTLAQVEDTYAAYHKATRTKYEKAMQEIRAKSMGCIKSYKDALKQSKDQLKKREEKYVSTEKQLRSEILKAQKEQHELEAQLQNLGMLLAEKETEGSKAKQALEEEKRKAQELIEAYERLGMSRQEFEMKRTISKASETKDQAIETEPFKPQVHDIAVETDVTGPQPEANDHVKQVNETCEEEGKQGPDASSTPDSSEEKVDKVEEEKVDKVEEEKVDKVEEEKVDKVEEEKVVEEPAEYVKAIQELTKLRTSFEQLQARLASSRENVKTWIDSFQAQEGRKPMETDYPEAIKKDIDVMKKCLKLIKRTEQGVKQAESNVLNLLQLAPVVERQNEEEKFQAKMQDEAIASEEKRSSEPSNREGDETRIQMLVDDLAEQRKINEQLQEKIAELEAIVSLDEGAKLAETTDAADDVNDEHGEGEKTEENADEESDSDEKTAGESNREKSLAARVSELESELKEKQEELDRYKEEESSKAQNNPSAKRYLDKIKAVEKKLKEADQQLKEARNKGNRLEQQVAKMEKLQQDGGGGGGGKDGNSGKLKKELEDLKKKQKKHTEEMEKSHAKQVRALEKELETLRIESETAKTELASTKKEVAEYRERAKNFEDLEKQNQELQVKAEEADQLKVSVAAMTDELTQLEDKYREEQMLRKKYWNMMEDMKGKIRVFARCRPMAGYELEKQCEQVVHLLDEYTIDVHGNKGTKQFVYDRVFGPQSTQEEVFEDTKNLIQSSLDGFNVCVFAYGQTGSGKTFTMVGSKEMPGIVLRSVSEIFAFKKEKEGKNHLVIRLYMMELYLDNLVDLLYQVVKKMDPSKVPDKPPQLDIKKDKSGTVFVKNAQLVTVETEEELLFYFERANAARKVSSTKMNAGSSRSHLVFSVVLENTDLQSKKTTIGKLSLVDLAGSERQEKTGATGDQLKEAMSINKSLSALGDVISALSSGESFIPYRNNKLTQLMSDSLGGNAKTLMFVNISPADYNSEESISSLTYASRVKLITNSANKAVENEEISNLKKIIQELRDSGGKSALLDQLEVRL